ncbi:MAG TPA: hypothetical protein VKQ10_03570 [Spirochaetota bacterium]|nr:hypothetical protein [Spirochaetota bacterium]
MKSYNDIIIQFMKSKADRMEKELSIPGTWYFNEGDHKEILSWNNEEALRVWKKIKENIQKHDCSGLRYELCPFCHKNGYEHKGCYKALKNPICMKCGYGSRHGLCISDEEGESEYRKILQSFDDTRMSMYKFFSNDYYKHLVKKLELSLNENVCA